MHKASIPGVLVLSLLVASPLVVPQTSEAGVTIRIGVPFRKRVRARARGVSPGPGWAWEAGHWGPAGRWIPGQWVYRGATPRAGWIYVPGFWRADVWVEGFWRPPARDGYVWVEGYLDENGEWQPGYWKPAGSGPVGMVWRPGYWDGRNWVRGDWVPAGAPATVIVAVDDGLQVQPELLALPADASTTQEPASSPDQELALPADASTTQEPASGPDQEQALPQDELQQAAPDTEDETFDQDDSQEDATKIRHHSVPE